MVNENRRVSRQVGPLLKMIPKEKEQEDRYLQRSGSRDALWRWQRWRRWRWGDHGGDSGSSCWGWVLLGPRDTNG